MKEFFSKYVTLRKHNAQVAWKKAKKSKMCYAFLAPYAILFTLGYSKLLRGWFREGTT